MAPSRSQFRISSLIIAVALAAAMFAAAHYAVALFTAFGLLHVALIGVLWSMFRGLQRLSALCFGIAAAHSRHERSSHDSCRFGQPRRQSVGAIAR